MELRHKGKCTGSCCEKFPLSESYEDLKACYDEWRKGSPCYIDHNGKKHSVMDDIFLLYPMLRLLGTGKDGREIFTCAHWDRETRLCGIYEIRPTMCRDYPYRGKCSLQGCTYEVEEDGVIVL
jgi:Fe-S-cluster containining protein